MSISLSFLRCSPTRVVLAAILRWLSPRLERYSYIRRAAKQAAIASQERPDFQADRVQKWVQADAIEVSDIGTIPEKALNPYFPANGRTC
jgi:hypothetical protein